MARVGQEARVEPDELPPPLRNDRRGVVVPALADHPAHKRAGLLVAPAERLEGLAEGAHHGEQPGGAEHQHERGDGAADPEDVAELPPVDLGRLPGREGQRDERFGGGRRMELPHGGAERTDPAAVALLPQHLEDRDRRPRGVLREQGLDPREERG